MIRERRIIHEKAIAHHFDAAPGLRCRTLRLRRECGASPQNLSVDGIDADCDKYNIDGSNYFKLRDLGDALGFTVDYDADSNTAIVLSKGSTAVYRPDHDLQI